MRSDTVYRESILMRLLGFNIGLVLLLLMTLYWFSFLKSSVLEYSNIKSDPFDGTVSPISYVPNWLKSKNTNKSMDFSSDNLWVDEFIELPKYDLDKLADSTWKDTTAILTRYTYPVVYMGDYKLSYEENVWSHPAVDIRAPIGTPVLSIANGVVIKVKNTETWDGKYVVIRHDNVKVGNSVETLYSSYEHLSEIFAEEWTKISKWEVLWKVWMTWITTTPHLHFQIDKKTAPFHPYWPYTFKDAQNLNLDFFGAVNFWLWKENAMAFTINPMEFVQDNKQSLPNLTSAPETENTELKKNLGVTNDSSNTNTTAQDTKTSTSTTVTTVIKPTSDANTATSSTINTGNVIVTPAQNTTLPTVTFDSSLTFQDIPKDSTYYRATKYLFDKWITKWYEDKTFKPSNTLTRKEALIFIFKLYNLPLDSKNKFTFNDIKKNDFVVPYLKKWLDLWLISKNKRYRPDDVISRAEFVTMMVKASKMDIIDTWKAWFDDVKASDWYSKYIETFSTIIKSDWKNKNFEPNNTFNRWQISQILYIFSNLR